MIQQVLIVILFLAALFHVARLVYKSFHAKTGCSTGCGKCSAIDFSKLEKQLREKGL
jgi:hypothetical protein